jgi:predicted secreted hydrolase
MQERDFLSAADTAAANLEVAGRGTPRRVRRYLRKQENSYGRRIARRSIAFNALAALSVATFFIPDFSAKAVSDAPLVRIPQDEAPHHDETEWWYFSGHLRGFDLSGKPHTYGYELVFFQFNFPNQPLPLYEGNLAVTDVTGGSFHYEQKIMAQPIPDEKNGFNLKISPWRIAGSSGANSLDAEFSDGSYGVRLNQISLEPVVLHGNGGLIPTDLSGLHITIPGRSSGLWAQ